MTNYRIHVAGASQKKSLIYFLDFIDILVFRISQRTKAKVVPDLVIKTKRKMETKMPKRRRIVVPPVARRSD